MHNTRKYTKSIRLDSETIDLIAYLDSMSISWQKLVVDNIKDILKCKAEEFNYIDESDYPF